jgi:putative membrane protein
MILELIIALIIGIIIGTITGLLPGIHINLVSALLISLSPVLLTFTSPLTLIIFIVSLSITHTFIDFIPSIFLGAPNEDTALSVLPGHQFLLEKKDYFAVVYSLYGCLSSLLLLAILAPLLILSLPKFYPYIVRIMPLILIIISGFLIIKEKNKFLGLIVFLFSGLLGIGSLNLNINEPLLPLFSGLFGASSLILSINTKTKIPKQEITKLSNIKLNKKSFFESSFVSLITSPLTAILPGMGSSQAALIGTELLSSKKNLLENKQEKENNNKQFLFLVGSTNIIVMALSFIAYYSINKTRTGSAVAISKLLPNINFNDLLIILTIVIISGIISFIISIKIARLFSKYISKINYSVLSIIILIILTIFTLIFSGFLGIIVFLVSVALGISCILLNVKRTNLMGCLIIPTILYYLLS